MTDQTLLTSALLDATRSVPDGLIDGAGNPAGRRFDIYRNNVAVALGDALAAGFPAIVSLIGPQNFKGVAALFLRRFPPADPRMMLYGRCLGDFLESFEPLAKYPYLADVARLEYAIRESYHAADHIPMDPSILQTDAETLMALRLSLAPSMRLISSPWPVLSLWAFALTGGPPPSAAAEDVVVLRAAFDPEPQILPVGGQAFLKALDGRTSLEAAVATASNVNAAFDLAVVLTLLLSHSALCVPNESPKP